MRLHALFDPQLDRVSNFAFYRHTNFDFAAPGERAREV